MRKTLRSWFNGKVISTLPIFVAVNLAAIVIWFLGVSPQAMPLILGMIGAGLVDLDDRFIGRLKNICVMLVVFSFSSFLMQLSIGHSIAFTLLFTIMAFVVTMFGAIGPRYSTMAFGALLVSLYTVLVYTPTVPWFLNPILIVIGAILYSLSSLCIFLIFPNRAVQESVGDVFAALSGYFLEKAQFFDPDDLEEQQQHQLPLAIKNAQVIQAFNQCQGMLFYRIRGQQRRSQIVRMMKYYFAAQEIFERVSADYFDYQSFAQKLKHTDLIFRIQRVFELQGQACADLAQSLQLNTKYTYDPRLERTMNGLIQAVEFYQKSHPVCRANLSALQSLVESLQAIDWQLRHINVAQDLNTSSSKAELHPVQITGLKNMWTAVKGNFTFNSPLFRHAVRLAVVVFISCLIVEIFNLHLGYWILMTAILVCQPNHYATKLRLKQRIGGSILGVLVGSLLPYMQPTLGLDLGIIVLTSTLYFLFRNNNFSYATFFITVQVLVSFYVMGFDIEDVMFSRIMYTLGGAFIAFLASSYLWPDWKYFDLRKTITQSLKVEAKYLLLIISQLQFGYCDQLQYRLVRRQAQDSASSLGNLVNIMNNDPKKYASRLPVAFELLKLNYTLLSYISALGAYRDSMANIHQPLYFMSSFYPIAKKMVGLLDSLDTLSRPEFDEKMRVIQDGLATFNEEEQHYNENASDTESDVKFLLSQLNLIGQILPLLYTAMHRKVVAKDEDVAQTTQLVAG